MNPLEAFLQQYKEATRIAYRNRLRPFEELLLNDPDAIDWTVFERVANQKRWAPNTQRLAQMAMRAYLREQGITDHPMFEKCIKREASRKLTYLKEDEVYRLLSVCDPESVKGLRDQAMIRLFRDTWIRRFEMAGAEECNLDLEAREITVRAKGGDLHTTTFSPRTARWLKRWLEAKHKHYKQCPAIFCNVYTGKPLTANGVGTILKKLGWRANVKAPTHGFRRGGASDWAEQGGNPQLGMAHGGWKCARTYTHYCKGAELHAFDKIMWKEQLEDEDE